MTTAKRAARLRLTLNKRNVAALEPSDKAFIAWDDKLIGFGVRVQPSGLKSFIVNYRAGDGGRKAPNKRVVIGRFGPVTPDQARRIAHRMLGKVADGQDPADKRARARSMPTLCEAFQDYLGAKSFRSTKTSDAYRRAIEHYLADWVSRPLNAIERREVEARFTLLTSNHGWAIGNQVISLLRSIYRRACVDHEGLRNPVDLWLAAGGRFNPIVRRVISSPAEALPYWQRGIEAVVKDPATRSIFWVAMYSGMRRGEILTLRWERVDLARGVVHVPHTKSGTPARTADYPAACVDPRRAAQQDRRHHSSLPHQGRTRNGTTISHATRQLSCNQPRPAGVQRRKAARRGCRGCAIRLMLST
ncbi:MAG: integrase arm-type DNA-binding domain-containing protein [Spirochaetaceae bacterium]|nr:integrase arm-type DNA-binding domain-containing protein [Spirochaetaceae bacterium]